MQYHQLVYLASLLLSSPIYTVYAGRNIGKYVAMGDSFSAGPGAGDHYTYADTDGKNADCSRYKGSYPSQVWEDRNGVRSDITSFEFLSCTGHLTKDMPSQMDHLDRDVDTITLSIGGNDANFGMVIRRCIYRFNVFPFTETDKDCERELNVAEKKIDDLNFKDDLFKVYANIVGREQNMPDFRLYITEYARFFEENSDQCDNASLGYWNSNKPPLTTNLRRRINILVQRMNDLIRKVGAQFTHIRMVEWDDRMTGHRFCESGITEPDYETSQTYWFHLYGQESDAEGNDSSGGGPGDNESNGGPPNNSGLGSAANFADVDTNTCRATSEATGLLGAMAKCDVALAHKNNPDIQPSEGGWIPDSWIRVFHPRPNGFKLMKEALYESLWFDAPNISNKNLRILPLGDSITNGFMSTDEAGYRGHLYSMLLGQSNTVDFVGTRSSGTGLADGDHEAVNGATINSIATNALNAYSMRPNVILLHAGTNDLKDGRSVPETISALATLIDNSLTACPDATIIVGTLLFSGDAARKSKVWDFNNQLREIVETRKSSGKHVLLAPMGEIIDGTSNDMADGLHPNNSGYKKMANNWEQALRKASANGWLTVPVGAGSNKRPCKKDLYWIPQGQIASGLAFLGGAEGRVLFADIDGDGRDDYLWVDNTGKVTMYHNNGRANPGELHGPDGAKVRWVDQGVIATGPGIPQPGKVMFADLNGDGRDDYLWVHDGTGAVTAFINGGMTKATADKAAEVAWHPNGEIANGGGQTTNKDVRMGHIQGLTREDYIIAPSPPPVGTTRYIRGFWNNGNKIGSNHALAGQVDWQPVGNIEQVPYQPTLDVQFADIDGDGLDDMLSIHEDSSVFMMKNTGLSSTGPYPVMFTTPSTENIASGAGVPGSWIMFADINGDGRAEYLAVNPATGTVDAYLNGCDP